MNANENRFLAALTRYLNNGGTKRRARELIEIAGRGTRFAMPDKGRTTVVPSTGKRNDTGGTDQSTNANKASLELSKPPVSPSPDTRAAALTARKTAAQSIWNKTLGGNVKIGGSTKHHWITMVRKGYVIQHVANRILAEIDWGDNPATTLEQVATEQQVKSIIDSGYDALER